jgi:hypothetical protein
MRGLEGHIPVTRSGGIRLAPEAMGRDGKPSLNRQEGASDDGAVV